MLLPRVLLFLREGAERLTSKPVHPSFQVDLPSDEELHFVIMHESALKVSDGKNVKMQFNFVFDDKTKKVLFNEVMQKNGISAEFNYFDGIQPLSPTNYIIFFFTSDTLVVHFYS